MTDTTMDSVNTLFRPGTSDKEIEAAALKAIAARKRTVLFWQVAILVAIIGDWEIGARTGFIDPFSMPAPPPSASASMSGRLKARRKVRSGSTSASPWKRR